MNDSTAKIIDTALDLDGSVSIDARRAAMAVLRGELPARWLRQPKGANGENPAVSDSGLKDSSRRKTYLRRHEAAEYIGCSVRHIDELKCKGELPFHRLGRKLIVFKADDLDTLVTSRRIDSDGCE